MNTRNAALAALAAISLIGLGCNRERNQPYGQRNYDRDTAQRTNQSGHDNADTNKLNDKYDNLADRDATGGGKRYQVTKVDSKNDTITLGNFQGDATEGQKHLQSGSDLTISYDDFNRYVGPTQSVKANDLKEGQVLSVFRDASGNISKIVVPKDKHPDDSQPVDGTGGR